MTEEQALELAKKQYEIIKQNSGRGEFEELHNGPVSN